MSGQALAILLAGSFTFGCAAIHAWREHAAALTSTLVAALVCLTILTGSVIIPRIGDRGGDARASAPRGTTR